MLMTVKDFQKEADKQYKAAKLVLKEANLNKPIHTPKQYCKLGNLNYNCPNAWFGSYERYLNAETTLF